MEGNNLCRLKKYYLPSLIDLREELHLYSSEDCQSRKTCLQSMSSPDGHSPCCHTDSHPWLKHMSV